MANLRIVFANAFEISATECGVVPHVVAEYTNVDDVIEAVGRVMEDGALASVRALRDDILLMEFTDVVLDGFQGIWNDETGNVTLHLYMHETGERTSTEEDLEKAEVYDILFGMEDEEDEA